MSFFNLKHYSEHLNAFLGAPVEITFKDGKTERGILAVTLGEIANTPYKLKTANYDIGFYKSHIKEIRRI